MSSETAALTSPAEQVPAAPSGRPVWYRTVLAQALLGGLLLSLAFPPFDRYYLWLLAWVAPLPWLLLVRRSDWPGGEARASAPYRKRSRWAWLRPDVWVRALLAVHHRPYRAIWWAGFFFWLFAVHWVRLPHPLTPIGWVLLAAYLGCYVPLFVWLSRLAVHRWKVPLLLAAPAVWTGLELARAHVMTGFLMAALSHTQVHWPALIQISDLGGAYLVSFLIMLVAACLARIWPVPDSRRQILVPLLTIAAAFAAVLSYGHYRLEQAPSEPGPRVGLIQGHIEPSWEVSPELATRTILQYFNQSRRAAEFAQQEGKPLDLMVWPETMFRQPLVLVGDDYTDEPNRLSTLRQNARQSQLQPISFATVLDTPLLLGIGTVLFNGESKSRPLGYVHFNSALLVEPDKTPRQRYDKMHRVVFGEFVPFAEWAPFLYDFTPLGGGLAPGSAAQSMLIQGVRYAPNICYETVVPHLIRWQVAELRAQDAEPDVLVNLTNDGWFYGTSELDMHLACGRFRAIECRKPLLIAANGGLTASVDSSGRIEAALPRLEADFLIARPKLDSRRSAYVRIGDWPAGICLLGCVLLAVAAVSERIYQPRKKRAKG